MLARFTCMYINMVRGINCFVLLFALTITNNTCTSQVRHQHKHYNHYKSHFIAPSLTPFGFLDNIVPVELI